MPPRPRPSGAHPAAAVALAGASLLASAGFGYLFVDAARDAWVAIVAAGPASPADGILLVVATSGALLSAWLGLGVTLSALAALPGALGQTTSWLAARVAPAAARQVVAIVLGTTLSAALAPGSVAVASTGGSAPRPALFTTSQIAFGGLVNAGPRASSRRISDTKREAAPPPTWTPDRLSLPADKVVTPLGDVVVHRGDTLWSIAAHRLGPAATESEIDREWRRWFAANRAVIGNNANAIEPGQVLSPPTPWPASR